MTLRWLTCFSLLAGELGAAVTGSVQLTNPPTAARRHKDRSGIVVWLEPVNSRARLPVEPRPQHVQMVQKDKKFIPHVLAIPVGTQVDFPNFDPIFHNAFSKFSGQQFDVGLYPPGTSKAVSFTRPGIVRVFCNIHQTMSAIIVVVDTPWFAVTNAQGTFQIPSPPPGEYRLHVFDERASAAQLQALERTLSVSGPALEIAPIAISVAGYVPAPHKNKYGEDYPPETGDHTYYPGARK